MIHVPVRYMCYILGAGADVNIVLIPYVSDVMLLPME